MKLGIVVTQTTYANKIVEITKAALKRGNIVSIFFTDDGIYLIKNGYVADLRNFENVDMSLCNFSLQRRRLDISGVPEGVINGTQYQNSLIHNECDKVLFF